MAPDKTYKNWKAVTEADFVSLFIKTWFAYISTLRTMFPEAYTRRGDKKYLDAYKKFYKTTGYKNFFHKKLLFINFIFIIYRINLKLIVAESK